MKTKRVFNLKFWSPREGRDSGNIICIFASSRWGFAATNLWVKSRLTKYIIVFTPRWLKVPILEMRSIWLLYEPQYYCPGIDCFISGERKTLINFIRISSRIAGCSLFRKTNNNKQKISKLSSLTDYWLRATLNVNVVLTDRSIFYEKHEFWTSYIIHILSVNLTVMLKSKFFVYFVIIR